MTVKELDSAPNVAALYPKVVLGGLRKNGGDTLPDLEFVRTGVVADPDELAAYNQVCGFRLADELPITYPHIQAFGMQMALMAEPSFPFPLLGMVHVANRITQYRPVRLDEAVTLRVRVADLRPHEKGKQFDVISEALAGDELVWSDVSTYLRRGGGSGSSGGGQQLAAPTPGAIWRVPGDIGRRYAEVSGDRNPIHLHPLTAKAFGFPSAIAHGMWTKARALAAFEGRLPDAYSVDVRFKLPVLLPAKVAFTAWRTDDGHAFEAWNARKPKPHLSGTITHL
ncbi:MULTISPECIES: MaoC family dehydratase [Prauserella salsuginis group]|uniref:Acyl dehydratase n=2 Tax=Prauserella salsuginis group TaxID=2893672 RepID=A0A839XS81_9PSEU|nr:MULTISPECIES: MaoC/PaaZ C-terminal domain-containing protein [Prauserella salsuginis group]MBB3662836.1 acyl dehydratase [Prauserella sediminis]MCR3720532.1 MaoC like domain-containing protein [Prauserella flava]MCR3733758.1 MaoC like domain-containing protein [Prauserella salsuginis]